MSYMKRDHDLWGSTAVVLGCLALGVASCELQSTAGRRRPYDATVPPPDVTDDLAGDGQDDLARDGQDVPTSDADEDASFDGPDESLVDVPNDLSNDTAGEVPGDVPGELPAAPLLPPGAGRTGDPCGPASRIDLDAMGRPEDGELVFEGSNESAPERSALALPGCLRDGVGGLGFALALRYTPRAGYDVVAAVRAQGSPWFAQFALDAAEACGPTAPPARECELYAAVYGRRVEPSLAFARPASAGAPVHFILRSVSPARPGMLAAGRFELRLREVEPIALGAACELAHPGARRCARGLACLEWAPGVGRCVSTGLRELPCRATTPRCDPGLVCDEATGRCAQSPLAMQPAGARCGGTVGCVGTSSCGRIDVPATCVRVGARGGPCRGATPECDGELRCTHANVCAPTVTAGEACDAVHACASGRKCMPSSATSSSIGARGVCVRDGEALGRCRVGEPRCDAGLECEPETTRCTSATSAGATGAEGQACRSAADACDIGLACNGRVCRALGGERAECGSLGRRTCAFGTTCSASERGTCVRDGALSARCRVDGEPCEPGLSCAAVISSGGSDRRCVPTVGAGQACSDATGCSVGLACSPDRVCVAPGTSGVMCREEVLRCDPGLFCVGGQRCLSASTVTGEAGSPCRTAEPRCASGSRCDEATGTCARVASVGSSCAGAPLSAACATGAACRNDVSTLAARCIADGARGGRCRAGALSCDAGLSCHGAGGADDSWCL